MGGKRVAEQVRRALVTAAKTMPIVAAIDATGCFNSQGEGCTFPNPQRDASLDAQPKPDAAVHDAGKDGG